MSDEWTWEERQDTLDYRQWKAEQDWERTNMTNTPKPQEVTPLWSDERITELEAVVNRQNAELIEKQKYILQLERELGEAKEAADGDSKV